MEILGIGPMELILILIVALMVFGPDKLPQIGAKLGRVMRDMRRATRAISNEVNATRAAIEGPAHELAEPFQDVADAAKAVGGVAAAARNPGQALRDSVMRELNAPLQPEPAAEPVAALPAPEDPSPPASADPAGDDDDSNTPSDSLASTPTPPEQ